MQDDFTIDPMLEEKARWVDKLHECGFVFDHNGDEGQTDLSYWHHDHIRTLKARLARIIDMRNKYYGHYMTIVTVEMPNDMGPDMNFGSDTTNYFQKVYDALMMMKNLDL